MTRVLKILDLRHTPKTRETLVAAARIRQGIRAFPKVAIREAESDIAQPLQSMGSEFRSVSSIHRRRRMRPTVPRPKSCTANLHASHKPKGHSTGLRIHYTRWRDF